MTELVITGDVVGYLPAWREPGGHINDFGVLLPTEGGMGHAWFPFYLLEEVVSLPLSSFTRIGSLDDLGLNIELLGQELLDRGWWTT